MIHILSSILIFTSLVSAAPVVVFQTHEQPTVFQTEYAAGATAGDPENVYTTLWSNAVSWTSTLWPAPDAPHTSEYSTVLPATNPTAPAPAPPAPAKSTAPAPAPPAPAQSTMPAPASPPPAQSSAPAPAPPASASPAPAPAPASSSAVHSHADGVVTITSVQAPASTAPVVPPTTKTSPAAVATQPGQQATSSPKVITTTSTSSIIVSPSTTAISGPKVTTTPKYMVYSPYNSDSTCKNAASVKSDLQALVEKGITRIRMYATDCNSLNTVQPAAKELGIRIVQGVWIGTAGFSNAWSQLFDLINSANGDWSMYDSIIIGNEDVTNGFITADALLSNIKSMRSTLQSHGYYGDVIAAETTIAYINNPKQMCDSSFPFIGLNAHSYFSPTFAAQQAGTFVQDQIAIVRKLCGRSDIWISETGYPHKGNTNGANVPNKQNQADAVNAILDAVNQDCVVLAQYDDMWKEPGQYDVEQFFGVLDIIG